jgi:tetratricopeptide (TPR) repeat protein
MNDWLTGARRARDVAALELALMLHTEGALDGFSEGAALGMRSWFVQLAAIRRIFEALRSLAPGTPFLRNWYLLWESIQQGVGLTTIAQTADYLSLALEDFPNDPEVLLAAGSRYEMLWWHRSPNPQRQPSGGSGSDRQLRTAADWLRRSLQADPRSPEPRLRLGRVLFLLGDIKAAEAELRQSTSAAAGPAFHYLGLLFLGDLLEHRGDTAAAVAAYRSAIGLVTVDQSARVASAQLAHKEGRRSEAAEEIGRALDRPTTGTDPWWAYIRGQWWRFETHRAIALTMVRR